MDSILLFPPGASGVTGVGSAIQLGSWLMADPGPDFGAQGLLESVQAQNSMRDGGLFAFRRAPIRKMAFPLIVNTPSVVNWESLLRNYSTPGAYIAVQPEGIPSSQAVYFDVIDGRWEPAYSVFEQRAHVRKGTLHLETQPFGYWPTEILLASSASVGFMGQLAINGASVIGDVPPLAHVQVAPTVASVYPVGGIAQWPVDMLGVSLAARPSFLPYISPASVVGLTLSGLSITAPTLIGDAFAPASQALQWIASTGAGAQRGGQAFAFTQLLNTGSFIPSGLEPAYRGRFRVFSLFKFGPSALQNFWSMADAEDGIGAVSLALATGNQLATVYNVVPTTVGGLQRGYVASPAYGMFDMGEMTLPPQGASGIQREIRMRLWLSSPSDLPSSAIMTTLNFGGLYLFPVDGAAGLMTGGLAIPSIGNPATIAAADFNPNFVEGMYQSAGPIGAAVMKPYRDARNLYRGLPLRLGASTAFLTLLTGDRNVQFSSTFQANLEYAQVSVSYRPQFQFLYGI